MMAPRVFTQSYLLLVAQNDNVFSFSCAELKKAEETILYPCSYTKRGTKLNSLKSAGSIHQFIFFHHLHSPIQNIFSENQQRKWINA